MERTLDIAVVGSGIGGLSAACLLKDHGHTVTVFDEFTSPQPVGSGLIIQPVGQRVLADIGVLGAALSHGVKIRALSGRNVQNDRVALAARYDIADQASYGLGIHRGTLFSLMLKAAQARQIKIVSGHMVLGVNDTKAPYLRIEGNRQAGPFDLVVDASGAGSQISPLVPVDLAYGALWGVVDLPEDERDLGNCLRQRYEGSHKMAGVLPIGTLPGSSVAKAAIFWSLKRDQVDVWRETDLADWKAEAGALWPDFGYLLEQIKHHDQMIFASYSHGSLNRVWKDRVVHIGDAAHRSSPQLGQGANMALLDGCTLAEAVGRWPIPKALSVYQRRRFAHQKLYQLMSFAMTPLYQSDRRLMPAIRDRMLTPLTRSKIGASIVAKVISGHLIDPFGGRRSNSLDPKQVHDILRGPGE